MAHKSEIMDFYSKTSILITGGLGFIGRILLEKLLATHDDLHCIYLIIRSRKSQSPTERLKKCLDGPVFQRLAKDKPNFADKICVLQGDTSSEGFGLNTADRKTLTEKIDIVFHCAANLNMSMKLKDAIETNVKGVCELLDLCHDMKRLKCVVMLSTTFSNSNTPIIEEKIYKPTVSSEILLKLVDEMDDAAFDRITPGLTHGHANTYTFGKNISEHVLQVKCGNLPVVVFRPSIVMSTYTDPLPGWSDNYYGVNGVAIIYTLGIARVYPVRKGCRADVVPVDFCVNALICSAWDATKRRLKYTEDVPVYNYGAGMKYSLLWGQVLAFIDKHVKYNLNDVMWTRVFIAAPYTHIYNFLHILLHLTPAYLIDFLLFITGGKPMMKKLYEKQSKLMKVLSTFTTNEWEIKNDNIFAMWDNMSDEERSAYPFHLGLIDYEKFFETYDLGLKVHVFKESLDDADAANRKYRRFTIAHYVLVFFFMALFCMGIYIFCQYLH